MVSTKLLRPKYSTVLIATALLLLSACGGGTTPTTSTTPLPAKPVASISASPNPIPAETGKSSTTVTWDTGDDSIGRVFVSVNGGPEKLFADNRPSGSHTAKFIENGVYEFRLYRKKRPGEVVASVKVQRQAR